MSTRQCFVFSFLFYFFISCVAQELVIYSVPLFASSDYSTFYTKALVGTPGQELELLFDINSPNTAIPVGPYCDSNPLCYANTTYYPSDSNTLTIIRCNSSCTTCVDVDVLSSHSNTFTKATVNGCGVTVYYSNFDSFHTSSVEAVVIRDNITLGASAPISFAGVYEESPDFADFEFDGILGFGSPNLLKKGLNSWFGTLVKSGSVSNLFSFCMDSGGGVLVIGGVDTSLFSGFIQYTPIVSSSGYTLSATDVQLNGASLGVSPAVINPVILDSTSADTILSRDAYLQLMNQIDEAYCSQTSPPVGLCGPKTLFNGYCFPIVRDAFFSYPGFSFLLANNVNVTLIPQYYLYKREGYYCSSVVGALTYQSGIVLGTNLMRRYYVAVDLESEAIGFSTSTGCSDASLVMEYVSGDGQTGATAKQLSDPLVIIVRGFKDDIPVPNINVTWEVNQGDGKLVSFSAVTDSNGVATASFELGYSIGTNIATASIPQAIGSPIIFTATGVKGLWFYVFNSTFLITLFLLLLGVLYLQNSFKKKKLEEEITEKMDELAAFGSKSSTELSGLLEWANLHDHPVREGGHRTQFGSIYVPSE